MKSKICAMKKIICVLVLLLAVLQTLLAQTGFSVEKSVRYLASEELEGRAAGTAGDSLAADYIAKTFANFGLKPLFEDYFSLFNIIQRERGKTVWDTIVTRNVIAIREGNDSVLKNRYIVICAHFDHLGRDEDDLYLGANDNASGTAAVLNIAQLFAQTSADKTLIFAAFGAEERGLHGSAHFVKNLPFLSENIDAVINFDMIGRLAYDGFSVTGKQTSKLLGKLIKKEARKSKVRIKHSDNTFFDGSDHYTFYLKNIPFLCFNTGLDEDHYHSPNDVVANIDFKGIETLSEIAFRLVKTLGNTNEKPDCIKIEKKIRSTTISTEKFGFQITLNFGRDSSYVFDGKIKWVAKTGKEAGLQAGDILLKINKRKINSEEEFFAALHYENAEFNKITVKRGQKTITVRVKQHVWEN